MRDRAGVAVVGTGISALALAYELVRRGVSVHVVEGPRRRAGRGDLGLVNAQTRAGVDPEPLQDLALLSRQLYADWVEAIEADSGLAVEYDVRGGIAVSLTDAEDVVLDRALDWQRSRSLPFTVLPGEEASVREPSLSEEIRTGFLFPLDGTVSPARLLRSLALAARSAGVRFHEGGPPPRLAVESDRAVGVETGSGRLLADAVVEADAEMSLGEPGHAPRWEERSRTVVEIDCAADGDRLGRFVFTGSGWIVPRRDGTATVAGPAEPGSGTGRPRAGSVSALLEGSARAVPALRDYRVLSCVETGWLVSPDGNPALGAGTRPAHFVMAGLGADEALLAPAAAAFLADVLTGGTPPLPPGPFLPRRLFP